jgi:hypothetical protein
VEKPETIKENFAEATLLFSSFRNMTLLSKFCQDVEAKNIEMIVKLA